MPEQSLAGPGVQAYGDAGFERWVDRADELAQACERKIEESGGALQLVQRRAPFNVCFWWVPAQLRPYEPEQATPAAKALLSKVGAAPCTQPCGCSAPLPRSAPCCRCRIWCCSRHRTAVLFELGSVIWHDNEVLSQSPAHH